MNKIDKVIRKFSIEKLEALAAILAARELATTTTVSGTLSKQGPSLGGLVSALSRTEIDGEPLILSAGQKDGDSLWYFNEKVASKQEVSQLVNELLGKINEYQANQK